MKKIIALILSLSMLLAFTACSDDKNEETAGTTAAAITESGEENAPDVTESENTDSGSTDVSSNGEDSTATSEESTAPLTDPSTWTNEEIVEFYKAAAKKSQSTAKSQQVMTLNEMIVNDGDGVLGKFVEWVTPIFKSALQKNSTEFTGITGGYEKLTVDDTQSVKAYKSGEYTVIEMRLKEQTDGIHADYHEGTVGHAISVVGDISVVEAELPQFDIDFENADLKIKYSDPTLKVKINKNGIIEKGTWYYRADITLANLHIEAVNFPIAVTVGSAHGSVDYTTTVGGGF